MMYHNCGLSPSGKVIFYDNEEELFNTPFDNFRLMVGDYVVAIELLNGMYTLYINDIPTDSAPVDTYGSDIGFFLQNHHDSKGMFTIDDIVMRTHK
jgi:hypothetical protein